MIEGRNKYILRYLEEELVKILKDSGYHSEEWEETDPEEVDEDEEAVKEKSTSVYIYDKWWRSSAVCIFIILLVLFIKNINSNLFVQASAITTWSNRSNGRTIKEKTSNTKT